MKRIIVIREGEKLYYKVKKRFMFFWWIKYKINKYQLIYSHSTGTHIVNISKTPNISFDSKQEAELFINWKNIKYLDKYIHIGCNEKLNSIVYVVSDSNKIFYNVYNEIFNSREDAKSFIEKLPRAINVYNNYK